MKFGDEQACCAAVLTASLPRAEKQQDRHLKDGHVSGLVVILLYTTKKPNRVKKRIS